MAKPRKSRLKEKNRKRENHHGLSLDEIFKNLPGLVFIRDSLTHAIVWCNPGTEKSIGYSEEQMGELGEDLFPLVVHPDDLHLVEQSSNHYLSERDNFGGVIRVRARGSKDYRWLVGISTIFRKDKNGRVLQTLCMFLDFTSVIHTETSLGEALQQVLSTKYKSLRDTLTVREREIIGLIVSGYKNKEIAKQLYLSQYTVEGYRKSIRLKLKVSSTPELVAFAQKIGLE